MKCPDCGHPLVDGSYLCANTDCPYHGLLTVPITAALHAEPVEALRLPRPVIGPTSITFCFSGEGEGLVAFTYEEMLALQRVARAQIEMEKKRGVNQR